MWMQCGGDDARMGCNVAVLDGYLMAFSKIGNPCEVTSYILDHPRV
jgi:hypothetical protein